MGRKARLKAARREARGFQVKPTNTPVSVIAKSREDEKRFRNWMISDYPLLTDASVREAAAKKQSNVHAKVLAATQEPLEIDDQAKGSNMTLGSIRYSLSFLSHLELDVNLSTASHPIEIDGAALFFAIADGAVASQATRERIDRIIRKRFPDKRSLQDAIEESPVKAPFLVTPFTPEENEDVTKAMAITQPIYIDKVNEIIEQINKAVAADTSYIEIDELVVKKLRLEAIALVRPQYMGELNKIANNQLFDVTLAAQSLSYWLQVTLSGIRKRMDISFALRGVSTNASYLIRRISGVLTADVGMCCATDLDRVAGALYTLAWTLQEHSATIVAGILSQTGDQALVKALMLLLQLSAYETHINVVSCAESGRVLHHTDNLVAIVTHANNLIIAARSEFGYWAYFTSKCRTSSNRVRAGELRDLKRAIAQFVNENDEYVFGECHSEDSVRLCRWLGLPVDNYVVELNREKR